MNTTDAAMLWAGAVKAHDIYTRSVHPVFVRAVELRTKWLMRGGEKREPAPVVTVSTTEHAAILQWVAYLGLRSDETSPPTLCGLFVELVPEATV